MVRGRKLWLLCAACLLLGAATQPRPILDYIERTWAALTRSHAALAAAAVDPKFRPGPGGRWPVYVPANEDSGAILRQLRRAMAPADFEKITVLPLSPKSGELAQPGLLYLPKPYVVPGGRFNEMYGWDSYFIQTGLLRDGMVALARDMADNFLYEVRNYGKVLNANRTYYLSRSQPPFLTEMLLNVYRREHDRKWLAAALPEIESYYQYWTTAPHQTPETGLSRYFDLGDGPAPEVLASERDSQGRSHYELATQYFRTHQVTDYDVRQYYDSARNQLTSLFYKGDRSMRESGFDPSARFGPFSADIIHYNPVCLNSLLYVMEKQTAEIFRLLDRPAEATVWEARASERAGRMNRLLWDEQDGLYYDYNFSQKMLRPYPFLTTFYPLWAGIATPRQAARIQANLKRFERPGGLVTSTNRSGDQWDAPFGWAPLEWLAIDGLRRFGYKSDADRITREFLSLGFSEYRRTGSIVEKYDVENRTSDLRGQIQFGYRSNEVGFGWTNAAFTALLDELPAEQQSAILAPR